MTTALRQTIEDSLPRLILVAEPGKDVSGALLSQCVCASARSKQLVSQSADAVGLVATVKERLALGKLSELLLDLP